MSEEKKRVGQRGKDKKPRKGNRWGKEKRNITPERILAAYVANPNKKRLGLFVDRTRQWVYYVFDKYEFDKLTKVEKIKKVLDYYKREYEKAIKYHQENKNK